MRTLLEPVQPRAEQTSGRHPLAALRWELAPLLALALALVLYYERRPSKPGLPFDDSYISLQFARNLAHLGFVTFDGNTASAGATSLLHVAILAVPIYLGFDPVTASIAVGVGCHLGLILAVYALAWTLFRDRLTAILAGVAASTMGYLVFDALNGMETTLFLVITTVGATVFLTARGERGLGLAGLLSALAILTRPEGILFLGALFVYHLTDPRFREPALSRAAVRRLLVLFGPGVLALGALAAFYGLTTGSLTPGAATAKMLFFREFELPVQDRFNSLQSGIGNFLAPLVPWLVVAALAARRREVLLFGVYWATFVVLYVVLFSGALSHYWYRYQHIFLPALVVFGAAGLAKALRICKRQYPRSVLPGSIISGVFSALVLSQYTGFREHYARDVNLTEGRQVSIARYLRMVVPEGGSVGTHDIGVIGYYSGRKVVDLVGLVNPEVVDYHGGRRIRSYVDATEPDYIVVFQSWEEHFLRIGLNGNPDLFQRVNVFEGGREPFVVYKTHYHDRKL